MSSGGIVLASLLAYWGGEFSNSFTLAKMKIRTRGTLAVDAHHRQHPGGRAGGYAGIRRWWLRSFGVFPWALFVTLVLTNYLFKCGVEAIMTPFTYLAVNRLKRIEQEDYYDRDTSFNPFEI